MPWIIKIFIKIQINCAKDRVLVPMGIIMMVFSVDPYVSLINWLIMLIWYVSLAQENFWKWISQLRKITSYYVIRTTCQYVLRGFSFINPRYYVFNILVTNSKKSWNLLNTKLILMIVFLSFLVKLLQK